MRKTHANLLRLIVVAAMLCSLIAITAAITAGPVFAGNQTAGNVTATPSTASSAAAYDVRFQISDNITAGGSITITFPLGVVLPTSIDNQNITVKGPMSHTVTFLTTSPDPTVSGQVVTIPIPTGQWVGGSSTTNCQVLFFQSVGITNPPVAKTAASLAYGVKAHSSSNTTDVTQYLGVIPKYDISTTSGTMGSAVTVTGAGWQPNGLITITGGVLAGGTADALGAFSVVGVANTTGAVNCVDGAGQTQAGGSVTWDTALTIPTFVLLPKLSVDEDNVLPGQQVTVRGFDFNPAVAGNITAANLKIGGTAWAGAALTALSTIDATGTLDDFTQTLTVPYNAKGAQTVSATDTPVAGTGRTATTTLNVKTPTVALNPTAAGPNEWVTITGTNWPASTTIATNSLKLAGTNWNTSGSISVDGNGGWSTTLRVLAAAATGSNTVSCFITGSGSNGTAYAQATLTVGATALSLTPSSGPRGSAVTITANNMTIGGSTIPLAGTYPAAGLYFAQADWNTAANGGGTAITVTSAGTMSPTTVKVPATGGVVGPNAIYARDNGAAIAIGTFTITQPGMTSDKTSASKGDVIAVTGTGWIEGTLGLVTLTWTSAGSTAQTVATITPGANGTWSALVTVPLTAAATNTINASDSYNNSATPITITLAAASISVTPGEGPVGTEVVISGEGFNPQTGFTTYTIGGVGMSTVGLVTDALGGFSSTATIPGLATGAKTITITIGADTATTYFTVTAAAATVATATTNIASQLVRVWGYTATSGWQMYDPADTVGSDLTGLVDGRGYWMSVSEACTLIYGGSSWDLTAGWNLIGW